jgi:uncharacterized membrane protein YbhN (UPF0104 family)
MSAFWTTLSSALKLVLHVNAAFVAAALVIELGGLACMAFRWRLLLVKFGARPTFWDTMLAYSGGVFVCNVTPARTIGGDATRGALIRRRVKAAGKLIAASVVYDRATDIVGVLVLAAVALPALRHSRSAPFVAGALVAAVLAAALPVARRFITARVRMWHDRLVGFDVRGVAAALAGCSIAVWLQDSARIMIICIAFGVWLTPSQAAALTLIRLTSTIVPVPAGLGVADGAMVAGLLWFGVPAQTAGAIAILERAILYGWSTLLGAGSLVVLGGTSLLTSVETI